MITLLNLKDGAAHLEQLARWHHQQWSYLNHDETLDQRIIRMQRYLHGPLIPATFIAVEDELLGSAALVENDMDTRPQLSPWLASVYVAPTHRRRGVGSRLVLHAMKQAKQGGIDMLYLFTPDKESFYHKLGWRLICHEQYHGHQVAVMQAPLSEMDFLNKI